MRRHTRRLLCIFFLGVTQFAFSGCALFGGDDELGKDAAIQYEVPHAPYTKVTVSGADDVWQNEKNGNTIAVNSTCSQHPEEFKTNEFLSGVKGLNITGQSKITIDGMPGERFQAQDKVDGVEIHIDEVVYRKKSCIYDIVYVAKKNSFKTDQVYFEHFIERFKTP